MDYIYFYEKVEKQREKYLNNTNCSNLFKDVVTAYTICYDSTEINREELIDFFIEL